MKLIVIAILLWLAWRYLRPAAKPDARARARRLLGVSAGADADTIRAAHRRMMVEVHPDRGGSAEAARRATEARDTLLAAIERR